jgi:ketosteroid isomerase-like protein
MPKRIKNELPTRIVLFLSLAAVCLPVLTTAPGLAQQPQPSVELPAELQRVLSDYEAAWGARDAAALAALFTEDGFVLPRTSPPVRGRDAIRAHYEGSGGPLALRALDYSVGGDTAFIIGAYAGERGAPDTGKFTLTLRQVDGRWLIASDMDSGNAPPGNAPSGNAPPGNAPSSNTPSSNTPPDNVPPGAAPPVAARWNTQALQRLMHEWEVKREKMELHLQPAMQRAGVDMWIILSREFNVDPMLQMFGDYGISGWYGHRNAYVFYDPGNGAPLERTLIGTHQSGRMREFFPTIIGYGEEGLKPHLAEYVAARDPQRIAINRSRTVAMADGITAELLAYLEDAIGPTYASRLVSAQPLIFDYISHRTPAELQIETEASVRTWHILRRAFSNEVVTPGETRLMDIYGFILQEWQDQDLEFNFAPGITIYRRGVQGGIDDTDNPVVMPGDLLHVDFGVRLMGLVTDQQHVAYVLHPDEADAPAGLRALFEQSVIAGDIYAEELKAGAIGHQVKTTIEARAALEGIQASIYGHTQGNWVHGAGARTVFDWPERYGDFAREPVRATEFWSIEYSVQGEVPEWDDQVVRIPREEDAVIEPDGNGARFLVGPQRELWLIRALR